MSLAMGNTGREHCTKLVEPNKDKDKSRRRGSKGGKAKHRNKNQKQKQDQKPTVERQTGRWRRPRELSGKPRDDKAQESI